MQPRLSANLPAPPYPADTKTKDWKFSIDHERLFASDTWALAGQDMRPWLLMLWIIAWVQRPAGSLPADHDVIAAKIGMDKRMFSAHSDTLLRGFALHSDGRLYHRVITEKIIEMLAVRSAGVDRAVAARLREQVMSRDGEVCAYCGTSDGPFHVDHIRPLSRGGDNSLDNLCVSCAPSNLSKGAKMLGEWRKA